MEIALDGDRPLSEDEVVAVARGKARVIRRRETVDDLLAPELT